MQEIPRTTSSVRLCCIAEQEHHSGGEYSLPYGIEIFKPLRHPC